MCFRNRITPDEMTFFVRGPAKMEMVDNPTEFPDDIYFTLLALDDVHANYKGMKDSLVDAGKTFNFNAL